MENELGFGLAPLPVEGEPLSPEHQALFRLNAEYRAKRMSPIEEVIRQAIDKAGGQACDVQAATAEVLRALEAAGYAIIIDDDFYRG